MNVDAGRDWQAYGAEMRSAGSVNTCRA